jgi:hypothetical protein
MPVAVFAILCSWWWTERPSETCRASYKNKQFKKLIHLLGCTIRMILPRYLIHAYSCLFKNILFWDTVCVICCRWIWQVSFWWCLTVLLCACGKRLGVFRVWYCLLHTNCAYKNGLLTYWKYKIFIFHFLLFLQVSNTNKDDPLIHRFLLQNHKFLRRRKSTNKGPHTPATGRQHRGCIIT